VGVLGRAAYLDRWALVVAERMKEGEEELG
jgi:hypothetical protein